jgi:SAM-dependent MidA family methyltransferase
MRDAGTEGMEATAVGVPWRTAMQRALYGPDGFFTRPDRPGSAGHFRTSANASPLFATALLRFVVAVDEALGRPDPLDVVDIGAGRGHLLRRIAVLVPAYLAQRLRLTAVELAARPVDLSDAVQWRTELPEPGSRRGLVVATEWLDNVPLDIAEVDRDGTLRYLLVEPDTGEETLGEPLRPADAEWAARWWNEPRLAPGLRVELGGPRDAAWAAAVDGLEAGLALTVDYGHLWYARPVLGTLAGYSAGRAVSPVPDGTRDLTVHVAIDAVCAAGETVAGGPAVLTTQRDALHALGFDGTRPPLTLASTDPAGYLRALSAATQAAELTDGEGLGGHYWLIQPVGIDPAALPAGLRP